MTHGGDGSIKLEESSLVRELLHQFLNPRIAADPGHAHRGVGDVAPCFPGGQALSIRGARPRENRSAKPETQRRVIGIHELENGFGSTQGTA